VNPNAAARATPATTIMPLIDFMIPPYIRIDFTASLLN
jgi:hypothetical protein